MAKRFFAPLPRGFTAVAVVLVSLVAVGILLYFAAVDSPEVKAAPIPPPDGYPKLSVSTKTVTPTLAVVDGGDLYYVIEMRNTGGYTATGVQLSDPIPEGVSYNHDGQVNQGSPPTFNNGTLAWTGDIGFDSSVFLSFSVALDSVFSGTIRNQAVISHPLILQPVVVAAETVVTNDPRLEVGKTAAPLVPGPGKPLTYTLRVTNTGQPAVNLPITVTDHVPLSTTIRSVGPDGQPSPSGDVVTWTRQVSLDTGEVTTFTFSVDVDDVAEGTVIANDNYWVAGPGGSLSSGVAYSVTVTDPRFVISKRTWPDPPGSNQEVTYTITVLNKGSLATDLVISDQVPSGVTYLSGGSYSDGVVTWAWPSLDFNEKAEFQFTVYIADVAQVPVLNENFSVCSAEGVCKDGPSLTSFVQGPVFSASAFLNPIAKKPGGGTGPVTPTLVVENTGAGYALDATAYLEFGRISVGLADLVALPPGGAFRDGPECGEHCISYFWDGDVDAGASITFTTLTGQNTIGGEEGTNYTATVVITDSLGSITTEPVTATAVGRVTHLANLLPAKSAPPVIGRGLLMTYTINVWNSGLSTDDYPSYPWFVETVPLSTSLVDVSDGGMVYEVDGRETISWTLPAMSTGETLFRQFSVLVGDDLISGTKIVNQDYRTYWYELEDSAVFSNTGEVITTTVREVGLIDSYKVVTPTVALPGPGNLLTHYLHIVNTSPTPLNGVTVYDILPWESSTYQRDTFASAGQVISDIVSVDWTGNVAPFASETVTFTVMVDSDYAGPVTNTATISHGSLLEDFVIQSVAYITDKPVLQITKSAVPTKARINQELLYLIQVKNLGQQATELSMYDLLPPNVQYVPGSATSGGYLAGNQVQWNIPVLEPGEMVELSFLVVPLFGQEIVNDQYGVACAEGVSAVGEPLVTPIIPEGLAYLPLIAK